MTRSPHSADLGRRAAVTPAGVRGVDWRPAQDDPAPGHASAHVGGQPALVRRIGRSSNGIEVLLGGVANRGRVFRVGDTVHRPVAPFRDATHALLKHLDRAGFHGAPRVLSTFGDAEVLSWIPGAAARSPLPDWALDEQALISVAQLIRGLHDALAPFDGSSMRWPDEQVPLAFHDGTISHNDLHPGNIVFDGGRAVGLIDFDLAGPGSVIWDMATVARCWCSLTADADTPGVLLDSRLRRFMMLLDVYGLSRADRLAVAEALVANHDWTYRIVTDAAARGHRGFRLYWSRTARRADRAREWLVERQAELRVAAAK